MKYKDLVVVNNSERVLALSLALRKLPRAKQRDYFAGSTKAGYFYLFRDDSIDPKVVMECVVSTAGDAISSLYMNHPCNAERNTLVRAREELVVDLARKIGLSIENVGIEDEARGRSLSLGELSTGQLIDLMAERMGKTIITSDSHVVGSANDTGPAVLTVQPDGSIKAV